VARANDPVSGFLDKATEIAMPFDRSSGFHDQLTG
jgi:hypothetical protein